MLKAHDGPCSMLGYAMHSDGDGSRHLHARLRSAESPEGPSEASAAAAVAAGGAALSWAVGRPGYNHVSMAGADVFKVRSGPCVGVGAWRWVPWPLVATLCGGAGMFHLRV